MIRRANPLSLRLPFPTDRLARFAVLTLAFLLLVSIIVSPLQLFGDPRAISTGPRLGPPDMRWPFGTDAFGRSLLPRVVQGIGATYFLAAVAVLITSVAGVIVGMAAGYLRGAVDLVVVRVADVLFSFPAILMAILVSAILGPGSPSAIVSIVLITLPLMVRVVRAATLVVADRDFVVASRVSGGSVGRILLVHILPNIAGAAIVQATYAISVAMLVESALSFLGLGVQPPDASLGSLLREGSIYLVIAPWLVFAPGFILALAILSVNLLGDGLRDTLDPREARLIR